MEQLKKGYKKTEVGLIPEDWIVGELIELTQKIGSGITPKGGESVYKPSGRPFIRSQNVGWGKLLLDDVAFIDDETHFSFPSTEIMLNDVFLNITGASIGRCSYAINILIGGNVNQHVCIIRTQKEFLYPIYLCYILLSKIGQKQIDSFQTGGNRQGLNFGQIKTFKIPLPPTLTEQKAIADALTDVDELITNLEKLISKKKAIKQGAMQQLLTPPHKGGKRLDAFSGDWSNAILGDVIDVNRGGSPRPIQDFITTSLDGINWIKIGDTSIYSKYITSSNEKIIAEGIQFSRQVAVGDFLLSNSMSFGRPYILKINGCIHDGWLVLQNYSNNFDREFLYYILQSREIHKQYLMKAAGSSVLNLNKELVRTVELCFPKNIIEQKAISKILADIDDDIINLELKLNKCNKIKQGMMQELLTGKTRLV